MNIGRMFVPLQKSRLLNLNPYFIVGLVLASSILSISQLGSLCWNLLYLLFYVKLHRKHTLGQECRYIGLNYVNARQVLDGL